MGVALAGGFVARNVQADAAQAVASEIRRKVVRQSLFSKLHYNAKVEWDNISRHEWPICDELKLPKRTNYTDFQATEEAAKKARAKRHWNAVRYGIKEVSAKSREQARTTLLPGAGKTVTEELIRQLTSQADKSAEAFSALVLLFHSSDYPLANWEAGAWSAFLDWNSGT